MNNIKLYNFRTSHMEFLIALNRIKAFQAAAMTCLIPSCYGLNMLGHLNLEEAILGSLIGNLTFLNLCNI